MTESGEWRQPAGSNQRTQLETQEVLRAILETNTQRAVVVVIKNVFSRIWICSLSPQGKTQEKWE